MSDFKSKSFTFKNVWTALSKEDYKNTFALSDRYKRFLDNAKTEREAAREIVKHVQEKGYVSLDSIIKKGEPLQAGQKIYAINKDKAVILFVIGKKGISQGLRVVGSHIDSPRIDIKPFPLYEDAEMAYLKTHYYGAIKKYQWASIPLALHGRIVKSGGEYLDISIGEKPEEPIFFITDLLPHLAKDQMSKKMSEGITGESLNIFVGSIPVSDKEAKHKVKEAILRYLEETYGMVESDFISAEIEAVPAEKARDVGFDRSFISGYGHDDKVCAYTSLEAILELETPEYTAVAMFMDKEEVGSQGNTGSESAYFEYCLAELLALQDHYSDLLLKRTFANTKVLSADVSVAYDPNYLNVLDKHNTAYMNKGICLVKYTGVRGKFSCSDANAEFIGFVKDVFDKENVMWQVGELGKVDQGGGGTIAYILANKGAEVIDCGTPVLSMHAPYELASKADIYMSYKGYLAFYKA